MIQMMEDSKIAVSNTLFLKSKDYLKGKKGKIRVDFPFF
jgi:hypothetical protein